VAHARDGCYSGGRDQEDGSLIPTRTIVIQNLFHNFHHINRAISDGRYGLWVPILAQQISKKEMIVIIWILLLPWTMWKRPQLCINLWNTLISFCGTITTLWKSSLVRLLICKSCMSSGTKVQLTGTWGT
jgi:hypothetical protein